MFPPWSHDDLTNAQLRSFGGLCNFSFRGTNHTGLFKGEKHGRKRGACYLSFVGKGFHSKKLGWVSKKGMGAVFVGWVLDALMYYVDGKWFESIDYVYCCPRHRSSYSQMMIGVSFITSETQVVFRFHGSPFSVSVSWSDPLGLINQKSLDFSMFQSYFAGCLFFSCCFTPSNLRCTLCCKDATFFDRGPILGALPKGPCKSWYIIYSCLWRDSYQPSLSKYIYIYHVFIMSSLEEWITKS